MLTGIHAYLGLHVLARGVIFVDLALAQVAALGMSVAFLAGHPVQSAAAYWYALVFTVGGAALFATTRTRRSAVPQEAVIGIVYAVSAAVSVLVVDRAPQGAEHIKQLLVGSLLTVTPAEVGTLAALYTLVGLVHWLARRPLLAVSFGDGVAEGREVRGWDFLFYASFGLVVTSSVRTAGVLLVFAYLIVPATAGVLVSGSVRGRLLVGWGLGALVSVTGLSASYALDLPTGATVVAAFGALLAVVALALAALRLAGAVRRRGVFALTGLGIAGSTLAGAAGLLLAVVPAMDHHWLDWVEDTVPGARGAFLTPFERAVEADSREALARASVELAQLRALQADVRWGARQMDAEQEERVRQFVTGRAEIAAGDRLVLRTLRGRARERQRYWLGVPLAVAGAGAALALARGRRGRGAARPPIERVT